MLIKLQRWASKPGLLSAVVRVGLASAGLAPFALGWIFVMTALVFGYFAIKGRPSPQEAFTLLSISMGLFALPALHVIYSITKRLEQRPFTSIGLRLDARSSKEFLGGMILGVLLSSSGFLYLYWSGALHVTWNPIALTLPLVGWMLVLTLGWLGVAFWEELYFRGYLIQTWASGIGIPAATLVSSFSFGTLHVLTYGREPAILLSVALGGLVLAVLYLKTKSLWAPIGMHFANNFWISHVLSIPFDGEIRFITVNGQPIPLRAPQLILETELVGGKRLADLYGWEVLTFDLVFYALVALLIWKLPWFRAHPEMEALWQQYVPIAQPWAHLKAWWAKRKGLAEESSQGPRPPAS
jgi:membrane protease YdiL (CAAX protease family)